MDVYCKYSSESHFNMASYNATLHIARQEQVKGINQSMNSQRTLHTLPMRARYIFCDYCEENRLLIKMLDCISKKIYCVCPVTQHHQHTHTLLNHCSYSPHCSHYDIWHTGLLCYEYTTSTNHNISDLLKLPWPHATGYMKCFYAMYSRMNATPVVIIIP